MSSGCSVLVSEIEDILVQILARLPVKSLMRFRGVSHRWRALIAEPQFIKKHTRYQSERGIDADSDLRLLFSTEPPKSLGLESVMDLKDGDSMATIFNRSIVASRKHDFPVTIDYALEVRNYGACNGLICIEVNGRELVVWNPCTGSYNVLPQPSMQCNPRFYGFGYDSVSDDYKIVQGGSHWKGKYDLHCKQHVQPTILVFSLKNGSWKTYPNLDLMKTKNFETKLRGQGTLLDGVLHWLEFDNSNGYRNTRSEIRPFSLAEEKFLDLISIPYVELSLGCLEGIGGLLVHRNCICAHTDTEERSGLNIYMMKEYGIKESWTVFLKLNLCSVPPELYNGTSAPLFIFDNGDFLAYYEGCDGQFLALYKQQENAFKTITRLNMNGNIFEASIYRETLVSAGSIV